ncbi:unnamed protein product [Allacma fusca]|uniref:Transposase n=1 Tax=Allacma fusca TaxID=39272 RepID=A0A8J2L3Q4_9HEXA|nr:unnamed protein product [Allacma fusca]
MPPNEKNRYPAAEKKWIIEEISFLMRNGDSFHAALLKIQIDYEQRYGSERKPCYKTVRRWKRNWDHDFSLACRKPTGRPISVTTPGNVKKLERLLLRKPLLSSRKQAAITNIKRGSCRRIVKKLRITLSRSTRGQVLKPADPRKRKSFCERMIERFNQDDTLVDRICWTDETFIQLKGPVNTRNDVHYGYGNPHRVVETDKRGYNGVLMWAGVIGTQFIGPFFIRGTITGEVYHDLLLSKAIPALRQLGLLEDCIFMQDGATPHNVEEVADLLNDTFGQNWIGTDGPFDSWPARSCDLTPPDYWLWNRIKEYVKKGQPKTIADIKRLSREAFRSLSGAEIQRSCRKVKAKFQQCVRRNGLQVSKSFE